MKPDHDKIRAARIARGMTIEDACTTADISKTGLINIEQGRVESPRADILGRLANIYGVTVDSLYTRDGEAPSDAT